jgi:hypothetical protein
MRGFYGLIYESQTKTINGAVERLSNIQIAASRRLEIPVAASESDSIEAGDRHRRVAGAGEVPDSLYSKVKNSVASLEAGAAVPVHKVREITKRQNLAYGCIDRLVDDGLIRQEKNGRYVKIDKNTLRTS